MQQDDNFFIKLDTQIKTNYLMFCGMAKQASAQLIKTNELSENNSLVRAYSEIGRLLLGSTQPDPSYIKNAEESFAECLKDEEVQKAHIHFKLSRSNESWDTFKKMALHKASSIGSIKSKIKTPGKQPSVATFKELFQLNKDIIDDEEMENFICKTFTSLRINYERQIIIN